MKSFVNHNPSGKHWLAALLKLDSIGFWLVWILLSPLVFIFFLFSDLIHMRFRHSTAWLKTTLVKMSVHDQMVKRK
jgi:hypothetical protein